jgi:hypothetical protein
MDSEQLEEYLKGTYIPLDCHFIVARATETGAVIFTEVYHIGRNERLQKLKLGEWDLERGPRWTNMSFYTRRRDLQGVTIKAAVISDVSMINVFRCPVFHGKMCSYVARKTIRWFFDGKILRIAKQTHTHRNKDIFI